MFNPKIYLPLNINREKQNNALITSSFKNQSVDLLDWLGLDLKNGDSNLVLSQKGTYVSNGSPVLTFDNGITKTSNNVQLGGTIIQNTTFPFDGTIYKFAMGDGIGTGLGRFFSFGNNSGGKVEGLFYNVDSFKAVSRNYITPDIICRLESDSVTGTMSCLIEDEGDDISYGLYVFDNSGNKTSNIYYGVVDGGGNVTDISRVEANKFKVHTRHVIDPTGVVGNYNGTEASDLYSQLEFNKTSEDGQASGTCWTLDTDGASLWVNGVRKFRIKNEIPVYADDAAATGGGLVTNDIYQTTTGGSTFLKIVP